ncbi:MAG: hypothetical protein AB7F74_16225 [Parvibaculaceae bacterium]
MTTQLRLAFLLAGLSLSAALSSTAQADSQKTAYTWPSHYDFFLPYGSKDGRPVYAKPGYKGVNLTLTCKEATGILKMHGYRDIAELTCAGDVYRFEVSRVEGRFIVDLDPRTGNIVRRQQL